jgi:hypothetical protein
MRTLISHTETVLATPEQLIGTTKYHLPRKTPLRYPIKCDVIRLDDGYTVYASWKPFSVKRNGPFWDDLVRQCLNIVHAYARDYYQKRNLPCPLLHRHIEQAKANATRDTSRKLCNLPAVPVEPATEVKYRQSYKGMMYRRWLAYTLAKGSIPIRELQDRAEQEGFTWASVLKYAEGMPIRRCKVGDAWQWELGR